MITMQQVRRFRKRERLSGSKRLSVQHEDERGQAEEQLARALPRPHEDPCENARGLH